MSILEEMFDGQPEPLNERPYSRTQSAIDSAKGKVKGMFGSGQVEQGAQETGQMANQLWSDFKRYIGRKYGSHPQSVPYADVAAFFNGNNLDTSFLGNNQRRSFVPKDVGAALMKAVQKQNTDYGNQQQGGSTNQPQQGSTNSQGQPQGQGQNNPQPSQGQGGNSGSSISGRLSSLSPADRAKLLKLIS
jgi:hypothetical protein